MKKNKKQKVDKFNAGKLPFAHLPDGVQSALRAECPCRLQEYCHDTKKWILPSCYSECRISEGYTFDQHAVYRVKPDPTVVIEVRGGVANVRGNPRNVNVKIIDYDNKRRMICQKK